MKLTVHEKDADPKVPVASNEENQAVESDNQNSNVNEDSQLSNDETPEESDSTEEEDSDALPAEFPGGEDLSDDGNNEDISVAQDQGLFRLL